MLVPIEWLNQYTKVTADIDTFCERMIMSGSNLETVDYTGEGIENVVVGKIEKIERHPDADKLVVCQLNVGADELVQIVTGAPNVKEGDYVPVALHGSKLPGPLHGAPKTDKGVVIKKGKLRGVVSNGMLCSASELGLEDKVVPIAHRDGIWILDQEYPLGLDIVEALDLYGATVDFEITPNRPDCLSMIGMARETAATFETELKYPDITCENKGEGKAEDFIAVEIKRPDLCRRYVAKIVTNIKIEQSPWWLQKRLIQAGMRPINNIVDITNYVMLEYGQPIHAFDIRNVKGSKIIVDTAQEGEKFTTLDEVERTLSKDTLLIKDGERGVALAGVMGGLNSEIEADTTTVLVEGANFNGDSVRTTSKKLGLRTEASARFEKGIDPNLTVEATERVCRLIEILGAGTVVEGSVDVYPEVYQSKTIEIRVDRVNQVMGVELSGDEMVAILNRLEIKAERNGNVIVVTPPTIRQDLLIEEDYIEEISRMYGYDKLPMTLPKDSAAAEKSKKQLLRDLTKEALTGLGMNEIQTYSFVSPKGLELIQAAADSPERKLITLINPLGEDTSVMRTTLLPNMLEVLARNYSRNIPAARAFEIGNTFINEKSEDGPLPVETDVLVAACYGAEEDFFTLKGMLEELFRKLGIRGCRYTAEETNATYHPGRCARIAYDGQELGFIGEIHPDVLEKYDIGTKVYAVSLSFDQLVNAANTEILYHPLPKYPAMVRDIAMVVEESVLVAQLLDVIKEAAGSLLESVALFDVYRGKQIAEGTKSAAFTLTYRASDRTLTDEEVTKVNEQVLLQLKEKCGAVLRDM